MQKFALNTLVVLIALLGYSMTCSGADATTTGSPEQKAWRLIDDGALLIDVRTRNEFENGHLKNAVNIPHDMVDKLVDSIGEDKSRDVVVYCRSGRRSGTVQKFLQELGYKNVHNGFGYEDLKAIRDKQS